MKMNFCYSVIARCMVYDQGVELGLNPREEDIELNFGQKESELFLFRFAPAAFKVGDFKLLFKYDHSGKISALTMFKNNDVYIVKNLNQIINDILEGYIRLKTFDKISDIMEFDFNAAVDILYSPEEEFEESDKSETENN